MKNIDLANVQEASEYKKFPAGGYVAKITLVKDEPQKEYLRVEMDIARGEFTGHFRELYDDKGFWGLTSIRSYKEKALPFFKGFITSVEESNRGFKFANDETKLVGKYVGVTIGEEAYVKNDGTRGTRLYVDKFTSTNKIEVGDFTVPPFRELSDKDQARLRKDVNIQANDADFEEISVDGDIPF